MEVKPNNGEKNVIAVITKLDCNSKGLFEVHLETKMDNNNF